MAGAMNSMGFTKHVTVVDLRGCKNVGMCTQNETRTQLRKRGPAPAVSCETSIENGRWRNGFDVKVRELAARARRKPGSTQGPFLLL